MIPLNAIPWRLIGYGVAIGAVLLLGWRVHAWHEAYKALPGVQDALKREEGCEDGSKCRDRQKALEAAQAQKSAEVVGNYEKELADLRNRPAGVRRVIRVCADPGDVSGSGAPGPADGPGTPGGVVHGAIEFDTAPLRDLASDADELAARLRALQQWNEALSKTPTK